MDWQDIERNIRAAQGGDEAAFGRVVQALHPRVHAVAMRYLGNGDDAREAVQMAWVKAWQKLGSYRQEARFYTWLYRIVANTAMDLMRASGRRKESVYLDELETASVADAPPAVAADPAAEAMRREQREAFERGLGELSDQHRMILILRELEGMSYGEIARTLGVRPGTVMSRLFYARKAMRKHLEDWR